MAKNDDNLDKVLKNFDLFKSLLDKVQETTVRDGLKALVDEQGERIAACPASTNTNYIGAFPGGLVWYSLEVLKTMKELNKVYGTNLSVDTMIVTALFHDIGKIGTPEEDYYLPQESDWHKNRGIMYELNPKLANGSCMTRSLWWLTSNCALEEAEISAISSLYHLNQRSYSELYNCSDLALVLQHAVQFVCSKMKHVKSL